MKIKFLFPALILPAVALILVSCETTVNSAPPVTAAFVRAGVREKADARTLEEGRNVFLNRCIACHALPDVRHYDSDRIPRVVGSMAPRANLNSEQTHALLKYLVTVKASAASE